MARKPDIFVAIALGLTAGAALLACGSQRQGNSNTAGVGGGAGTAAGGGMGGGVPTFEPRVAANDCSSEPTAPTGAVIVDTAITCTQASGSGMVAAGAADRGFVLFGSYGSRRLITVEPSGAVTALRVPSASTYIRLLSDRSGAPYLQAEDLTGVGLGFYSLDAQGWWLEAINPMLATVQTIATGPARFAADGQAYLPYQLYDGSVTLSRRSGSGVWTPTSVVAGDTLGSFELAIDSQARPHVLLLTGSAVTSDTRARIRDWIPGSAGPVDVFFPVADVRLYPSAAPTTDGRVAIAVLTLGGIHIVAEQAAGAATDLIVSGTPYLNVTGCPPLPPGGTMSPTPCTATGDGIEMQVLARTNGALWLVYLWRHVDMDRVQSCGPFENSTICNDEIKADRSTAEIVIVRLAPDGGATPAPQIVWRTPTLSMTYASYFNLDSTETRLLITSAPVGLVAPTTVRYVMLDANKL